VPKLDKTLQPAPNSVIPVCLQTLFIKHYRT